MTRDPPLDDEQLLKVLKALAEPKRYRMVQEIAAAGELSCGAVGERFAHSQPTISHHLKILSDAGVVVMRQDGQHHLISVNAAVLEQAFKLLPRRLAIKAKKTAA